MSDVSHCAEIEGRAGTFVVPAHSPYDRQILREYVERRVGGASLTLGVRGTRWTITRRAAPESHCSTCTQLLGRLSCRRAEDADATCIDCVMQPGGGETTQEDTDE